MTIRKTTSPGSTPETAIMIVARDSHEGIEAENRYLDEVFGKNWRKQMQCLSQIGTRRYDGISILLGRRTEIIWFDISSFLPVA